MDNEFKKPFILSAAKQKDADSGLMLYRGMATPWDQIKSFTETYKFLTKHYGLLTLGFMNALDIMEPDDAKRLDLLSELWIKNKGEALFGKPKEDKFGMVKHNWEKHAIPPFMEESIYGAACVVDESDEALMIPGYIWYVDDDRAEKELYDCPYAICGVDCCDFSACTGGWLIQSMAKEEANVYLTQRLGEGDPCCHLVYESKKRYGEDRNPEDNRPWEHWGEPAGGRRPNKDMYPKTRKNMESGIFSRGYYSSPMGATFTAGQFYQGFAFPGAQPTYTGTAIDAIRELNKTLGEKRTMYTLDRVMDTAGKSMFGTYEARKATREWLGVPEDIDDGRVMGGYISMIFQCRNMTWDFTAFSEEKTVLEVNKAQLENHGRHPEMTEAYTSYFNGMVKTLVNTEWVVRNERDDDVVRFIIEKAPYGIRRHKPGFDY